MVAECINGVSFNYTAQTGTQPVGANRHCRVLLHGAGTRYPAAHHEIADHQEGAVDPDEAATAGQPARKNPFPDRDFPHLFPNHPSGALNNFRVAMAVARQMMGLRDSLVHAELGFLDARACGIELRYDGL